MLRMVNMESWIYVFFRNKVAFKERTGEDFTAYCVVLRECCMCSLCL